MILTSTVLGETEQGEYVQISCLEQGSQPLLQVFDYSLKKDEIPLYKGKLVGKAVKLRVDTIRSIFSGRPQFAGALLEVIGK